MDVAIIGGGPAGAYCAFELAKKGINAKVFDGSHPREKPCGGGISALALEKFPFLEQFCTKASEAATLRMISCTGRQSANVQRKKGFNVSRQVLDQAILKKATDSGAILIREKVLDINKVGDTWQIKTDTQLVQAHLLVGADGINSLVRRKTVGSIAKENLGLAYGYYAAGLEKEPTTVKFTAEIPGYIWIFPQGNQTAIGIGSEAKYGGKLKAILDEFLYATYPKVKILSQYAAMLPWATDPEFFSQSCAGTDWVLIGDAAGHADPLTGEGIPYALWSAKLAAEAIAKKDLGLYDKLWQVQYGNTLKERCKQKDSYYNALCVEFMVAKHSFNSNFGMFG